MAIRYFIPEGEVPDEGHDALYHKQDDGSYLLQVTGLPEELSEELSEQVPEQVSEPVSEPVSQEGAPHQNDADESPACHGAGTQTIAVANGGVGQTIIAPHDSEAIQKSLNALATGQVRLG